MNDIPAVDKSSVVGQDIVCERVQSILRVAALRHTDASLGELSGVPSRTIKSYRVEGREPSLSNALSLAVVLGPRAVNSILSLIQYAARPLEDASGAIPPAQIIASVLPHLSVIATAAADGRVDHTEEPACQAAADAIIAAVLPLSSAWRRT